MLKKISLILSVIMLAGMLGLHSIQNVRNQSGRAELLETNLKIQQLEKEKAALEARLALVQAENEEAEADAEAAADAAAVETRSVVLCCNTMTTEFYNEVYPAAKEKGITGIFIMKNGQLPGDNDMPTVEEFLALEKAGWSSALCLTQGDASNAEWQAQVETYVTRFTERMGKAPRIFCFGEGGCTEEQAAFLSGQGFNTVLVHDEMEEEEIGGLKAIQLLFYKDPELDNKIANFTGYCGLEMWVGWNDNTDEAKRYTKADLKALLGKELLSLDSLKDLQALEPMENQDDVLLVTDDADTIQAKIDEINQELQELYY